MPFFSPYLYVFLSSSYASYSFVWKSILQAPIKNKKKKFALLCTKIYIKQVLVLNVIDILKRETGSYRDIELSFEGEMLYALGNVAESEKRASWKEIC